MSYPLKSLNLSNFTFNRTHKLLLNQLVSSGQEKSQYEPTKHYLFIEV